MATFEISRRIAARTKHIHHCAHYAASAWDPLGRRIHCHYPDNTVFAGNRVKIIAWHGQSMVVEYIQVQAPTRSAMKMIAGPRFIHSFAGSWQFTPMPDGGTQARWRYQLRTTPGYRWLEFFLLLYFAWESRRRLATLAAYCEKNPEPAHHERTYSMSTPQLTLLYDGSCPICAWEKRNLSRKDKLGKMAFIDIHAPGFDAAQYGTTMDALMARLHAVTPDGRIIQGIETILESYRAVGWWWAYLPLSVVPRHLAEKSYDWFASHRHGISRRIGFLFGPACDQGTCRTRE